MKILISAILLIFLTHNAYSQGVTTLDFVKIQEGRTAEAHYFYTQNWEAFRAQALASEWITDYQLLEADHENWDLILITSYADSIQYNAIEDRYAGWQEQNSMKLLNDFKPNDFRINIEAIKTKATSTDLPDNWVANDRCNSEPHRAFDFWIGIWEVTNPDGQFAGRNTILPNQGGCVLHENWISANGEYKGTSFNYYNRTTGKWNQSWIDNQGGVLEMSGGIEEGKMVMSTLPSQNSEGELQTDRITWISNADGTVEQIWERSVDNETTWMMVFHGIYSRTR